MGSGNSVSQPKNPNANYKDALSGLMNGSSSVSTFDSSHSRKLTDEEKNARVQEGIYSGGGLGISVIQKHSTGLS